MAGSFIGDSDTIIVGEKWNLIIALAVYDMFGGSFSIANNSPAHINTNMCTWHLLLKSKVEDISIHWLTIWIQKNVSEDGEWWVTSDRSNQFLVDKCVGQRSWSEINPVHDSYQIHLISPGCPWSSFTLQNHALKHQIFQLREGKIHFITPLCPQSSIALVQNDTQKPLNFSTEGEIC